MSDVLLLGGPRHGQRVRDVGNFVMQVINPVDRTDICRVDFCAPFFKQDITEYYRYEVPTDGGLFIFYSPKGWVFENIAYRRPHQMAHAYQLEAAFELMTYLSKNIRTPLSP